MEQTNSLENVNSESTFAENTVTPPSEKMVPQSKVNDIAHQVTARALAKGREQGKAEALAEWAATQPTQQTGSYVSVDEARRLAAEEAKNAVQEFATQQVQQYNQAEGQRLVAEFHGKIDSEKESFPELAANISKLGLEHFPHVVFMANSSENTVPIMNELFQNPLKMESLENLARKSPYSAQREMQRLAESIKINQKAANAKIANEPLSQLKPSSIGADNGSMSVSDFRKIFR